MDIELNTRSDSFLSVALLWNEFSGETTIEMETPSDWARFVVPPECASDAFLHPFAYRERAEILTRSTVK